LLIVVFLLGLHKSAKPVFECQGESLISQFSQYF
jgi:hypothetical protein